MPEIICGVSHYKSLEHLEEELELLHFLEIHRDNMDPPIRRVCERSGYRSNAPVTRMELVKVLVKGQDHIMSKVLFGMVTNNLGDREFAGVHKEELFIVWVNGEFAKKRMSRYKADPFPPEGQERRDFVKKLMWEIIEKWSSTATDTMGTSYARICLHVADYSNIEMELAHKLVDELLPTLEFVENTEGDHFRIYPAVMEKPKILIDVM